jgi:hypothetical protein
MKATIYILFLLILVSCTQEKTENSISNKKHNNTTIPLVKEAQKNLDASQITYTFNSLRAETYLNQSKTVTDLSKLNLLIKYSTEKINSGDTKPAIEKLEQVLEEVSKADVKNKAQSIQAIKRILVIANMRLGEQENCIQKHNHESCIVPIQSDGFHELEQGSRKAIEYLMDILKENPRNPEAIWILNLAYMTLGEYPEKVPATYLLPPSYFNKNTDKIERFDNLASKMGIGHELLSGSVIIEDFDADGDLDIFSTSWGFEDNVIYYENDGQGGFSDKTSRKNLDGHTGGLCIKPTDFNNDGLVDIYIMRGAWMMAKGAIPNTLLENTGNGFKDVTLELGLNKHSPTQACDWIDINKDGWLDLLVFNESFPETAYPTQLWMNNQGKSFTDVAPQTGLTDVGFYKAISVGDVNNDGWDDIYVSQLGGENLLYMNKGVGENGLVSFINIAKRANVTQPIISFPTMMFDFNNDGLLDIVASSFESKVDNPAADFALNILGQNTGGQTLVYINKGDGTFNEIHEKLGMNEAIYAMGCNHGDLNNDGWTDLYFGTGDPSFFSIIPNKVYLNDESNKVHDVTYASGMGHIQKGHGVSFTDLDRDGFVDVYAVMGGAYEGDVFQNAFFHNPQNNNNSITLKLIGERSNKLAIGAKVIVLIEENGKERAIHRRISSGASFGSNCLETVIGVGQANAIKSISIKWPNVDKTVQTISNLPVNKFIKITEGNSEIEIKDRQAVAFKLDKMHHH